MPRCAFLTLSDPTGYVIDDERAIPAFASRGWEVDTIPWTDAAEWKEYEAVLVRSTWDYHRDADRFFSVLEDIADQGVRLFNSIPVMRWNANKEYLADLAEEGVSVVPTLFGRRFETGDEDHFANFLESANLVIKPVVGANAERTWRLGPGMDSSAPASAFNSEAFMVQPFVRSIKTEGEWSLFFFNGVYSHAILKRPKEGDFRVQEEHGGRIEPAHPSTELLEAAGEAMAVVTDLPLYARVDLVRGNEGGWWIMEFELIEPSMYLRMDPQAPERFADAFVRRMSDV